MEQSIAHMCAFVTDNVKSDNHVIASNEGTAIAMAAGHFLGTGRIPCVYLQNSGLGNTVPCEQHSVDLLPLAQSLLLPMSPLGAMPDRSCNISCL